MYIHRERFDFIIIFFFVENWGDLLICIQHIMYTSEEL